ncbi:hypothetical protein BJY04DRAFT_79527 [Aspergillus karnatakaensis]|uniref:protein HGH1 n=1 Tax=Aspergillus karnatakaensis TaxID=1810916 RepID=UPI003CCCCCCF
MKTELDELVEFLHHGNTQIRQIACETLVGYSASKPEIFKRHQLLPIQDLKLLVRDYTPIASNALTILVNLSGDQEVLDNLATDDAFLETLLLKVTNNKERNANGIAMLFANLAKSDKIKRIFTLQRRSAQPVSSSLFAVDQLMDCFVKGAEGALNQHANYDYLSYLFADLSKLEEGRTYFTSRQEYDGVVPVTKLTVFTEHTSTVRRRGVASTIKNVAFDIPFHPTLLSETEANLLPYILLPIMGPEEYSDEDTTNMLPDLQLLPPDKQRDTDNGIIVTHLETLLLLTTTRQGRDRLREINVYAVVRECHLHSTDDDVQEACDRLVQVLMRDEEDEGKPALSQGQDDDQKVVELF